MFTGIVRAMGTVKSLRRHDDGDTGCKLEVDLGALDAGALGRGDSVAVNGACLTVAELRGDGGGDGGDGGGDGGGGGTRCAVFEVSPETLDRCLIGAWSAGDALNLEPALTLQTPLGGHLLTGHIDATVALLSRAPAAGCARMQFAAPRAFGRLIAAKGSVALDGVSLTVNAVVDHGRETRFEVMVVPHTLASTTLGALQPGARVHLEADILARYAQRLLDGDGDGNARSGDGADNNAADNAAAAQ
ncbi:MAG: riboflavin synthase [Gammaproteobacteria bacterium]|nr:riboflavin synthase [Gammaproteobacteria bacterium]